MPREESFGIIPLRKNGSHWEVLLICHRAGHWAFPKGHPSPGESPKQTAERELKEETALQVVHFLSQEPFEEHYTFKRSGEPVDKKVTYFLAEVSGAVILQSSEIADYKWVALSDAASLATFAEARRLCEKLVSSLRI